MFITIFVKLIIKIENSGCDFVNGIYYPDENFNNKEMWTKLNGENIQIWGYASIPPVSISRVLRLLPSEQKIIINEKRHYQ